MNCARRGQAICGASGRVFQLPSLWHRPLEKRESALNKYMIRGGRELYGEITVSGAKNAAVAIIPAALLVDGVCRIENIPQISDVTLFFSILEELGARVRVLNRPRHRDRLPRHPFAPARPMIWRAASAPATICWAHCWAASVRLQRGHARRLQLRRPPHRPAHQGLHRHGRRRVRGGRLHPRRGQGRPSDGCATSIWTLSPWAPP